MLEKCERTEPKKDGGLIFEEMDVQSEVQSVPKDDGLIIFGYMHCGPYNTRL